MLKRGSPERQALFNRVTDGTAALLHMENGRRYYAIWEAVGSVTAWWPRDNRRRGAIGLYTPDHIEIVESKEQQVQILQWLPGDPPLKAVIRKFRITA